jgi:hypothetical protein
MHQKFFALVLVGMLLHLCLGCRTNDPASSALENGGVDDDPANEGTSEELQAVTILRDYCALCHQAGANSFFNADSDQDIWDEFFTDTAPSGKSWALASLERLAWPTEAPPPGSETHWMPFGGFRKKISQAKVGGINSRLYLIEAIKKRLELEPHQSSGNSL